MRQKEIVSITDVQNDISLNMHDADEEQIIAIAKILFPYRDYRLWNDDVPCDVEVSWDD